MKLILKPFFRMTLIGQASYTPATRISTPSRPIYEKPPPYKYKRLL